MAKKHADLPLAEAPQIESVISRLQGVGIIIPDPGEVRHYLQDHPDMSGILLPVCKLASERFGRSTQLSLQLHRDREIEDEYLTLYLRQEVYEDDILDRIQELWAEYDDQLANSSGWLLVTTDFRPPR